MSEIKVQGGRQGFSSRPIGQAAAACVPGARAATIEAAGHMASVENPIQTATLLMQFIAEN